MIEWARIAQLRDDVGQHDFDEVVTLFLAEVDEAVGRLDGGAPPEAIAAQLHYLKGSALNLGFRHFADLCQQGEAASREGRFDPALLTQLRDVYGESRRRFLADLAARV
ncbi:Hpt domain-containing protein [Oceaniglobus roseus]|uniref:Hpt domain-containing protein n=1 Tax=Oceaniglobus roseus TaxID=1737570 RepID=UPI000C7F374F|nr:Hpt domain-containing protein [Kandeliimicrobium roseum]